MVPTVVEFENPGSMQHVDEQAQRIAAGMGKAHSLHPQKVDDPDFSRYTPYVAEVCIIEGTPPEPEMEIEWTPELA